MQRLLIATRNRHKTAEFAQILDGIAVVEDLHSYPDLPEIAETGSTFMENAILKAEGASRHVGEQAWVLADDSGLAVDALGGEPGVRSARYAGEKASDAENLHHLLNRMEGEALRSARFHCAIAIARGGTIRASFEGRCEGRLATTPSGEGGFGYDPAFIPHGENRSFAELSATEKNAISHRALAMREALAWLQEAFG